MIKNNCGFTKKKKKKTKQSCLLHSELGNLTFSGAVSLFIFSHKPTCECVDVMWSEDEASVLTENAGCQGFCPSLGCECAKGEVSEHCGVPVSVCVCVCTVSGNTSTQGYLSFHPIEISDRLDLGSLSFAPTNPLFPRPFNLDDSFHTIVCAPSPPLASSLRQHNKHQSAAPSPPDFYRQRSTQFTRAFC